MFPSFSNSRKPFIETDEIKYRASKIRRSLDAKIPVLLIGQTGTGKTAIAEYVFEGDEIVQFNFSAETTIDQLIGYPTIENSKLTFHFGPFADAFINGKSLILDEFNLAHEDVLQCIEAALDSKFLYIDDPMQGNRKYAMHLSFKLIATQNEVEQEFAKKRNKLTTKLISKFNTFIFNPLSPQDFYKIGAPLINPAFSSSIEPLINFHMEWIEITKNDPTNITQFTIRNFLNTILSLQITPPTQAIPLYYGSSYSRNNPLIQKLQSIIEKYFPIIYPNAELNIPYEELENAYLNPVLKDVIEKIYLLSSNEQPILLVGPDGCGKTQIAKWAAQLISPNGYNMMVCTPETNISDLIGNYVPISSDNSVEGINNLPVQWVDGPIIKSITDKKCIILDQIECALPQIIERINPLFDAYSKKAPGMSTPFFVNERPGNNTIPIKDGFKLIATSSISDINKLSPAILNRFSIVYVDNQLESLQKNEFERFIRVHTNDPFITKFSPLLEIHKKSKSLAQIVKVIQGMMAFPELIKKHQLPFFTVLCSIFFERKTPQLSPQIIGDILPPDFTDTRDFHFRKIMELENIIALMIIMQKMNQHIILQSTTGLGKTSSAMMLAKRLEKTPYKVNFNSETKISDLYGNLTIKNGMFNNSSGQLYLAMNNGGFFIADELNLADTGVMQSLTTALEQKPGEEIFLPNIEHPVKVSKDFFFIGCQNDTTMFGRKKIPSSIKKKVVLLEYPFPDGRNLFELIKNIVKEMDGNPSLNIAIQNLIIHLKQHPIFSTRPWSFREVRRFINRTIYFNDSNILYNISKKPIHPIYHAVFMIYSTLSNPEQHIKELIEITSSSFNITETEMKAIELCLTQPVEITEKDDIIILKKGNIFQRISKPDVDVNHNVKSFWNSLFFINLIPPTEPLLIAGPSGFKTFLASQVSHNPRVVSLNRESNTSSLIGSISLVDKSSYNSYLFDLLISIANAANLTKNVVALKKLKNTFNGTSEDFSSLSTNIKALSTFMGSLKFIINNIVKNITDNWNESSNESLMRNYTTVFKPGLITSQILNQRTLILKNFAKPPVAVIERFNELFALKPELTLNEDYTNTLVPPDHKIISFEGKQFRIIATCNENELSHLSEAMLSRMNVIRVPKYSQEDINAILGKSFCKELETFEFIECKKINDLSTIIEKNAQKFNSNLTSEEFIKLAMKILSNQENNINKKSETPLKIQNGILSSKFSFIQASTPEAKLPNSNIVFTKSVQIMVDRIFSAFALNRPIILQGPNGNCKSEAVKYVSKCFGMDSKDIITIQLSRSTTVENLFGQNGIRQNQEGRRLYDYVPTEFLKAVADVDDSFYPHKKLIIIEELNLASPSVIDALIPVFNADPNSRILQPNGVDVPKKDYYIVGISSVTFHSDLLNNSIVFTKNDYDEEEFKEVTQQILSNSADKNEVISLFTKIRNSLENETTRDMISIRSAEMYAYLEPVFRDSSDLMQYLKYITYVSPFTNPPVNIEINRDDISIQLVGSVLKVLGLSVDVQLETTTWENNKNLVTSLTSDEKDLFILLAANMSKRFPIIVQGPTCSGKSFVIQLFANIIGKDITVIQMNSDTSLSSLLGGYKPSATVQEEKIASIVNSLQNCGLQFVDILNDIQTNRENITVDVLNNYLVRIRKEKSDDDIEEEKNITHLIHTIEDACLLFNNIELSDSSIVEAMVNGKWLLLDGIEAAPPDVIERIITLLNPTPTLNLFEKGVEYSANPSSSQIKIHDSFRIFMTYNPYGQHRKTYLPSSALSRCVLFSMKEIDDTLISSALIAYYNSKQAIYETFESQQDAALRIAMVHQEQKKGNRDESNIQITGRTLIHVCQTLSALPTKKITLDQLKSVIFDNYDMSIDSEFDQNNDLKQDFKRKIKDEDLEKLKSLTTEKAVDIESLITIIENFTNEPKYTDLLDLIVKIPFGSFQTIIQPIEELLATLMKSVSQSNNQSNKRGSSNIKPKETKESFSAVLFMEIKKISEQVINLIQDSADLQHYSFSTIDINKYKGFTQSSFALNYISDVIKKADTSTVLYTFIPLNEDIKKKCVDATIRNKLNQNIRPLVFITNIDFTRSLSPMYSAIYASYKLCYEKKSFTYIREIDQFYDSIKKIVRSNPDKEIKKIAQDSYESFYNTQLTICSNEIYNFINLCKRKHEESINKRLAGSIQKDAKWRHLLHNIIAEKLDNFNYYKKIAEIFDKYKFTFDDQYIPELQEQIQSFSQRVSYDFTEFHELETTDDIQSENKWETNWFLPLAKYNACIENLLNLERHEKRFEALIRLEELMDITKIFELFKKIMKYDSNKTNTTLPKIIKSDKRKIKQIITTNFALEMFKVNPQLLVKDNLIKLINSYATKEAKIYKEWILIIKETNNHLQLSTPLKIPKLSLPSIKQVAYLAFPELKNEIEQSNEKNFLDIINKSVNKADLVNLFTEIFQPNATEVNLIIDDSVKFNSNIISYFDNHLPQAIFLSQNINTAKQIDNSIPSINSNHLLYGVFLVRLYSPASIIKFYTQDKRVSQENINILSEASIQLLKRENDPKIPPSFVGSFLLDSPPSSLENRYKGHLLHDAFIQVLAYSDNSNYQEIIKNYLPIFVSQLIPLHQKFSYWETSYLNNASNNFLLRPVEIFLGKYKSSIKEQQTIINTEITKIDVRLKFYNKILSSQEENIRNISSIDSFLLDEYTRDKKLYRNFCKSFDEFSEELYKLYVKIPNPDSKIINITTNQEEIFKALGKFKDMNQKIPFSNSITFALYKPENESITIKYKNQTRTIPSQTSLLLTFPINFSPVENDKIELVTIPVSPKIFNDISLSYQNNNENSSDVNGEIVITNVLQKGEKLLKSLRNCQTKLNSMKKPLPEEYHVIYGGHSLDDLINALQSLKYDEINIKETLSEYSKIKYKGNDNFKPGYSIDFFNKIMELSNVIESNKTKRNNMKEEMSKFIIDDSIKITPFDYKPPDSKELSVSRENFTVTNTKPLQIPAITINSYDDLTTNFSSLNISVTNILLGLYTSPIKININCFGEINYLSCQVFPDDLDLPQIETEIANDSLSLIVPIDEISERTVFKGSIQLNQLDPINYNIQVTFKDTQLFVEIPGNPFKYDQPMENYKLPKYYYENEVFKIQSQTDTGEKLHQTILFENIDSKSPKPPVILSNEIGETDITYTNGQETKHTGAFLIHCYFTPKIFISFISHELLFKCPILVLAYSHVPKVKQFVLPKDTCFEIGSVDSPHFFCIRMYLRVQEKPIIKLIPSVPNIIITQHNFIQEEDQSDIDDEFDIEDKKFYESIIKVPFKARIQGDFINNQYITLSINSKQYLPFEYKVNVRDMRFNNSKHVKGNKIKYLSPQHEWKDGKPKEEYFNNKWNLIISESHISYFAANKIISTQISYNNQNGRATIINTDLDPKILCLDKQEGYQKSTLNSKDPNAIIGFLGKHNEEEYWFPAATPDQINNVLRDNSFLSLNERIVSRFLREFLQKTHSSPEILKDYESKVMNYRKLQDKTLLAQEIIQNIIKERYYELGQNCFYLYFPINYSEVQREQSLLQKQYYSNPFENNSYLDKIPANAFLEFNALKQALDNKVSGDPVLLYDARSNKIAHISDVEKSKIIAKNKPLKTTYKSEFEIKQSEIEFHPALTYFRNVNDPSSIYMRLKDACKECKSFPIALFRYNQDQSISEDGVKDFNSLFRLYKWTTNENTLKNSAFISLIREYNIAFSSLVRTLIESGVKLSAELINIAGSIPNVVEIPHQNTFNNTSLKKDWDIKKGVDIHIGSSNYKEAHLNQSKKEDEVKGGGGLGPAKETVEDQEGQGTTNVPGGSRNGRKVKLSPKNVDDLKDWLLNNLSQKIDMQRKVFNTTIPSFKEISDQELNIQPFISAALPLTFHLVNEIKKKGTENFFNTDAVLLIDISNTISKGQKVYLFTTFCAYSIALSILKIRTNFTVFADANLQMTVKDFDEDFSLISLQKVLDTFSVNRQVSNLYFAIDYLNSKIPQRSIDSKSSRSIFVFSDGLFVNMLPAIWTEENILNKKQETKLICILLPNLLEKDVDRMINPYQEMKNSVQNFDFMMLDSNETKELNDEFYLRNKDKLIGAFVSCLQESPPITYVKQEIIVKQATQIININKEIKFDSIGKDDKAYFINQKDSLIPLEICRLPPVTLPDNDNFIVKTQMDPNQQYLSFDSLETAFNNIGELSNLFEPNKPSQATPSEKGYGISLLGLIRCTITNGQDKRIYLEKNAGYVPSYSCFAIVDCSSSVCSLVSLQHTLQTVIILLKAISKIENVSFSLILATKDGPIELCLNKSLEDVMIDDSPVLLALNNYMNDAGRITSIADALNAVHTIRSTQSEKESVCFVFTDAEYQKEEIVEMNSIITALNILKTDVIGVGVGLTPQKIDNLFSTSIWSANPINIPHVLGQLLKHQKHSIIQEMISKANNEISDYAACLPMLEKEPIFTELVETLGRFTFSLSSTQVYVHGISSASSARKRGRSRHTGPGKDPNIIPEDFDSNEDYDLGQGKKWPLNILLCQFWDAKMVAEGKENKLITYETLVSKRGIVHSLHSLGIQVDITQNYRESIAALISGKYHQVWIICGRGDKRKPTTRPPQDTPDTCRNLGGIYPEVPEDYNLALAFVDNVNRFREMGGGVAFWADAHFTYELDYFLQRSSLYHGIEKRYNTERKPVSFKFDLIDPSKESILQPNEIAVEKENGQVQYTVKPKSFDDRDYFTVNGYSHSFERRFYGFNVIDLYEGDSIACADPNANIYPFQPFSYSTQGYISGAYYMAPINTREGDIIIDGAASRLFIELNKCGIRRLVRNMAVWLTSFERFSLKMKPEEIIRSKPFSHRPVPLPAQTPEVFKSIEKTIEIAFVFDSTNSTLPIAKTLGNIVTDLKGFVQEKYGEENVRVASVTFKDAALARLINKKHKGRRSKLVKNNQGESFDFVPVHQFDVDIFKNVTIGGGCGDGPEDWVDAFERVNKLSWSNDSRKIIIMLTDQGCHGLGYHRRISARFFRQYKNLVIQADHKEGPKIIDNLKRFAEKDIDIMFLGSTLSAFIGYKGLRRDYTKFVDEDHLSYYKVNFDNETAEFRRALSDKINIVIEEYFMADGNTFVRRKVKSEAIGYDKTEFDENEEEDEADDDDFEEDEDDDYYENDEF